MPMPGQHDHKILTNSPIDRVIGMLLERLEAVRELHASMREEADEQRKDMSSMHSAVARLVEKIENHDKADSLAFLALASNHTALSEKIDNLALAINTATTAGLVQKAQLSAGWRVIATIGAVSIVAITLFGILFNHKW